MTPLERFEEMINKLPASEHLSKELVSVMLRTAFTLGETNGMTFASDLLRVKK